MKKTTSSNNSTVLADSSHENQNARLVPCPRCRKKVIFSSENPFRPFCTERCQVIDLGAWASENYRVASEEIQISEEEFADDSPDANNNLT